MEFRWHPSEPIWELARLEPELHAHVCSLVPALGGLLGDLAGHFPYQEQPLPGEWGPYCRPRQHWRAFYYEIGEGQGCLAFKGTEAHSQDFEEMLDVMVQQSFSFSYSLARPGARHRHNQALMSVLERFLFVENKFPGMVLLSEALSEAERARQFQREYFARYGRLARVPLPLLVHRVGEDLEGRLVDQVCGRLAAEDRPRLRGLGPLGLWIYWYPQRPLRVAHLELPISSPRERLTALGHGIGPRAVVNGWVELLAGMLCLGYLPADPLASLSGLCVEAHNLTLDGGMVDLDSLRPMASFGSVEHALAALERSFEILNGSICRYLLGERAELPSSAPLRAQVTAFCRSQNFSLPEALARWLEVQGSAFEATLLAGEIV